MNELELKALLILLMCADPTPLSEEMDAAIVAYADKESRKLGHDDWIVAYHEM